MSNAWKSQGARLGLMRGDDLLRASLSVMHGVHSDVFQLVQELTSERVPVRRDHSLCALSWYLQRIDQLLEQLKRQGIALSLPELSHESTEQVLIALRTGRTVAFKDGEERAEVPSV